MMTRILKIYFTVMALSLSSAQAQESNDKLTLNQCIEIAMSNNPSLLKSDLSLAQTRISSRQAYAGLYPQVGLSASTSSRSEDLSSSDWSSQWSVGGSVDQVIYRPGLYSGIKMAKINEKISRLSDQDLKTQVRLSVSDIYYQLLTSHALILVYEENIRIADENLAKIRLMYRVGSRTESDVLKAEVQKSDFQAMLLSQTEQVMNLKRSLNILLGRSTDMTLQIQAISPDELDVPDPGRARELMLENNREYQILKRNFESQRLALNMTKESFLPSVSGYYSHSKSGSWSNDTALSSNQAGIRASIDLFSGFEKRQNVQREKLEVKKMTIDLEEKERELVQQLSNLYTRLDTFDELIKIREKSVESARRDFELVTERYVLGASTILDQMNAQASLLQSQSDLVKVKYSRKIVEAEMKQLLGE